MNKNFILGLITCFTILVSKAQDADLKKAAADGITVKDIKRIGWVKGGYFGMNLSNTTFSNWAAGGTNNTSAIASSSLFAIYRPDTTRSIWENYLELAYGVMRSGDNKVKDPASPNYGRVNPFIKNEDKLVFVTKYGRRINDKLNTTTLFSLNTQMFQGWAAEDIYRKNNHISNFMAQGFGYLGIGIDYKPVSYLSVYFSPLTAKYTIVREQRLADLGLYGVRAAEYDYSDTTGGKAPVKTKDGQKYKTELGWYLNVFFKKDIAKNINLQTRLELFNNYLNFGQNIDFNLQTSINMKINKLISFSLINQIMYDYDVDTNPSKEGQQIKVQIKNFAGLGLSMKFGDKL